MFWSVVAACMCIGEVTLAPSAGVETQTEPSEVDPGVGGGVGAAVGNGATPLLGPTLSSTVTVGHEAVGVGVGAGAGPGFGVPGVVTPPVEAVFEVPPQPSNADASKIAENAGMAAV